MVDAGRRSGEGRAPLYGDLIVSGGGFLIRTKAGFDIQIISGIFNARMIRIDPGKISTAGTRGYSIDLLRPLLRYASPGSLA